MGRPRKAHRVSSPGQQSSRDGPRRGRFEGCAGVHECIFQRWYGRGYQVVGVRIFATFLAHRGRESQLQRKLVAIFNSDLLGSDRARRSAQDSWRSKTRNPVKRLADQWEYGRSRRAGAEERSSPRQVSSDEGRQEELQASLFRFLTTSH